MLWTEASISTIVFQFWYMKYRVYLFNLWNGDFDYELAMFSSEFLGWRIFSKISQMGFNAFSNWHKEKTFYLILMIFCCCVRFSSRNSWERKRERKIELVGHMAIVLFAMLFQNLQLRIHREIVLLMFC